jgi:actin related protein 2/3 complex subunit 3
VRGGNGDKGRGLMANARNREAQKEVQNIALDNNFAIPGDPGFPLNQVRPLSLYSFFLFSFPSLSLLTTYFTQMFNPPTNRQEAETLRQYLSQVRQELASRLLARIYEDGSDKPSKWWLSFAKRKFMGKSL